MSSISHPDSNRQAQHHIHIQLPTKASARWLMLWSIQWSLQGKGGAR